MATYPERSNHFAHKLTRLMLHSCAAQDIGTDGVLLVMCIAHCEDAKRYAGPVTYWNEQLMPILGFNSWGQLDRARKKAVDAGWLHYECGGKRSVGRYWTMIPLDVAGVEDCNPEADYHAIVTKNGDKAVIEPGEKCGQSGDPSSLSLSLSGTGSEPETDPSEKRAKPIKHEAASEVTSGIDQSARQSLAAMRIKPVRTTDGSLKGIPSALETAAVAAWWRGHIARDPLTGDTGLDLLLVLSAAAYARKSGRKIANKAAKLAAMIRDGTWIRVRTDLAECLDWMRRNCKDDWLIERPKESVA